jgi:curved DNA-binding protein CbpA
MNPYSILQIPSNASLNEIKKAYHNLALLYHPDKSSGEQEMFNSINSAYTTLCNPESRLVYDTARKASQNLCIDTVLLGELTILEDGSFSYDCRCGDVFQILKACCTIDNVFSCESCSLSIRVEIEK